MSGVDLLLFTCIYLSCLIIGAFLNSTRYGSKDNDFVITLIGFITFNVVCVVYFIIHNIIK